uniref:BZIP domain-containing protein n=1 Tax=Globisporangium ultimum (strain ATCC 200006 / CBS 805.95 / DAOM BR144) TaxID=431595 RepID=K3W9H9_GLOUD
MTPFALDDELRGLFDLIARPAADLSPLSPSPPPSDGASSSSPSPTVATSVDRRRATRPLTFATLKRNRHREKRKCELQLLRTHTLALERDLHALRQQTTYRVSRWRFIAAWHDAAQQERARRIQVKDENNELRAQVLAHSQMAASIQRVLERMAEPLGSTPLMRSFPHQLTDTDVFSALTRELDATLVRRNAVFHANAVLTDASRCGQSVRHCHMTMQAPSSDVVTPVAELTDVTLTPFRPRLAAKIMWRTIVQQYDHPDRFHVEAMGLTDDDNTITVKYRAPIMLSGDGGENTVAFLTTRLVVRRYPNEKQNGMALVWRAYSVGEDTAPGTYADETGWSVVEPLHVPGSRRQTSRLRQCVHVVQRRRRDHEVAGGTAESDRADAREGAKPGKLTDLVLSVSEKDFVHLAKAMETLLIMNSG